MNCITLLTDFGTVDEYVGVMKGVILTIHPAAAIVDICHDIPPGDIPSAARMLTAAYGYFPRKTVHVCVVDPGVGTNRAVLAARADDHFFVAPDNGILFPLLSRASVDNVVRVHNADFFLPEISRTFHGRDVLAPVAAHLLRGVSIADLGPPMPVDEMVSLALPRPQAAPDGGFVGTVTGADRFGNLLTNIESRHIDPMTGRGEAIEILVGGVVIPGLSGNYGRLDGKTCLALIGSRGILEIAVSGGSAKERLKAKTGDPVTVRRKKIPEEMKQDS
ncbi:S-adenosyl-l-methionine hydroxide adenosyltransferase family protein [Desulfococcus sp.]|uniref:SAM hydrolase/SAM-dependent halogenase family protein n=1 Tax=Desulfococcus sp. TaxID=2025834 RepID=UPI0035931CF9